MKDILIKLYQAITAPMYNRLSREMTVKLQVISQAYAQQHERMTTKMIDELTKLSIRLDQLEKKVTSKEKNPATQEIVQFLPEQYSSHTIAESVKSGNHVNDRI